MSFGLEARKQIPGKECGPAEGRNDLVMKTVYDYPRYYEIAFSFRDIAREVDVFEECIARYSRIVVGRILEIASGNSPHMKEIVRRGYEYTGLDISEAMLDYSRKKAGDLNDKVLLINADMRSLGIREHHRKTDAF